MFSTIKTISLIFLILFCLCSCSSPENTAEPSATPSPVSDSGKNTPAPAATPTQEPSPSPITVSAPDLLPKDTPDKTPAPTETDSMIYTLDINKPSEITHPLNQSYRYEIDLRLIDYVGCKAYADWHDVNHGDESNFSFRKYFKIDDDTYKAICKDEEWANLSYVSAVAEELYVKLYELHSSVPLSPDSESPTPTAAPPSNIEAYFTSDEAQFDSIIIGVSTAEQLVRQYGEPDKTECIDDKTNVYYYGGACFYAPVSSGIITKIVITEYTEAASPRSIRIGDSLAAVLSKFPNENNPDLVRGQLYGSWEGARGWLSGKGTDNEGSVYRHIIINSENKNPFMMLWFKNDALYKIVLAQGYFFSNEAKYNGITINHTRVEDMYEALGVPDRVMYRYDDGYYVLDFYYNNDMYECIMEDNEIEDDPIKKIMITEYSEASSPRDIKIGDSLEEVLSKFPYEYDAESNKGLFFGEDTMSGAGGKIIYTSVSGDNKVTQVTVSSENAYPALFIRFDNNLAYTIMITEHYN